MRRPLGVATSLNFYLYVNSVLAYTTIVYDESVFRLPTGYRADKFEVRITGNARVKAVQLGETPISLKEV